VFSNVTTDASMTAPMPRTSCSTATSPVPGRRDPNIAAHFPDALYVEMGGKRSERLKAVSSKGAEPFACVLAAETEKLSRWCLRRSILAGKNALVTGEHAGSVELIRRGLRAAAGVAVVDAIFIARKKRRARSGKDAKRFGPSHRPAAVSNRADVTKPLLAR